MSNTNTAAARIKLLLLVLLSSVAGVAGYVADELDMRRVLLVFAFISASLCLVGSLLCIDAGPVLHIGDRQTASATLDDDDDLAPETAVHLTDEVRHARR